MDHTHIMENKLRKAYPFRFLVCVVNGLSNFETLLNSTLFAQLNFPQFSMIYKDFPVYSNVAATFLATIESFRYAYKRNPLVTLILE